VVLIFIRRIVDCSLAGTEGREDIGLTLEENIGIAVSVLVVLAVLFAVFVKSSAATRRKQAEAKAAATKEGEEGALPAASSPSTVAVVPQYHAE
jgi:hypothetical protein